jgi:hypothetical protein
MVAGRRLGILLWAAVVGALAFTAVLQLQDAGYKGWLLLLVVGLFPVAAALSGRPKELLLFGWIVSLTYNRQYFIFEKLVGYHGTNGPYVIIADLCFIGLFAWWLYERIIQRRAGPLPHPPLWPWYLPFCMACFLSIFGAARTDWAVFEMIRLVKIGLIFFYVRHNFGRREWYLALVALGAAACFQSAVAIKEVATGKAGIVATSQPMTDSPDFIEHFQEGAFMGGIRGQGTMAHPPYLSCYLLLIIPVLLAVSLAAPRWLAWAGTAGFLISCGGLGATLSRWPWMVACFEAGLVLTVLMLLRQVAVTRALGVSILGALLLLLCLLPFKDKLVKRFTGDFKESVEYRKDGLRASLAAIADRPLMGFGLNNTAVHLPRYFPELDWGLVTEEFASRTLHLRAPITLGNGLQHVIEETGFVGFFGFLILIMGAFVSGFRAMIRTAGQHRAVCFALLVGILGVLAEQVIDAPLWVDPVLYTFALSLAMLNAAGSLSVPAGAGKAEVA